MSHPKQASGNPSERQSILSPVLGRSPLPPRCHTLTSTADFINALPSRLDPTDPDPSLPAELQSQINTLRTRGPPLSESQSEALARSGVDLWNRTTRAKREHDAARGDAAKSKAGHAVFSESDTAAPAAAFRKQLVLCRALAFHALDRAERAAKGGARLLGLANKAARLCLDEGLLECGVRVLERAAEVEDGLGKEVEVLDEGRRCRLSMEYYGLRVLLAWKQGNSQLVEAMYQKAVEVNEDPDPASSEMFADLLFEMGKDWLSKKECQVASTWLERAHDVLMAATDRDQLTPNADELRLSILQRLVHALLGLRNVEAREKASDIVSLLEKEYEGKQVVSMLKLDILKSNASFDGEQYYGILHCMTRTIHLTNANFKMIMHHVHEIKKHASTNASRLLDDFLLLRLFDSDKGQWVEKALVTRVWISTEQTLDDTEAVESLQDLMTAAKTKCESLLSISAIHAVQTLLWKKLDYEFRRDNFEAASNWSELGLHPLFDNGGELNRAKFSRKLIQCSIMEQDFSGARRVFNQMSESNRAAPLTRVLMYKLALREQDTPLAAECLEIVSQQDLEDVTLLYACVLEAQQSGNRSQAVAALQQVLKKCDYGAPRGVHLPVLIRCAIRLLHSPETVNESLHDSEFQDDICKLFERAASHFMNTSSAPHCAEQNGFDASEVDWFARNSYNIAMRQYGRWTHTHVYRLLEAGITFMRNFDRSRHSDAKEPNLERRRAVCHALAVQTLQQLAHVEDQDEMKLHYYFVLRKHAKDFQSIQASGTAFADSDAESLESLRIAKKILASDFEAAIQLQAWDDLATIIKHCSALKEIQIFEALADMIIGSGAPQSVVLETLDQILRATEHLQTVTKQARWLRILHQISISTKDSDNRSNLNDYKVDEILERAIHLANKHPPQTQSTDDENGECPAEEVEWLATTTFNRAVDAYCAADEASCQKLAEQALDLAGHLAFRDGGALRDVLMQKYGRLSWNEAVDADQ